MIKQFRVEQLRLGMHIHKLGGSWVEDPCWRKSFVLAAPKDLKLIVERGVRDVRIDTALGLEIESGPIALVPEEASVPEEQTPGSDTQVIERQVVTAPGRKHVSMHDELERATKAYATSRVAVTDMFQQARMGRAVDSERANALVSGISASIMRNPDALISMARMKTADDYTFMHSVGHLGSPLQERLGSLGRLAQDGRMEKRAFR